MKKVLLINGSPNEYGCTYTALKEVLDTLNNLNVEGEIIWIGNKAIPGCIACNKCKEGKCIFNDKVNEILTKSDEYGAIVIGSPVYYASASGQLISFLDRLFYASKGKLKHKLGASIVSCRRGGASATFDELNKYFSISSMPIVTSSYWNSVHGNNPSEVKCDLEGLETMRNLGKNLVWLMKCIECGEKNNINAPLITKEHHTNFIR